MKRSEHILRILFPAKCIFCRSILEDAELHLCCKCKTDAPEYRISKRKRQFLDSFVAVWYYEENVRRSILRFKFYNARSYAAPFGQHLAQRITQEHPEGFDCLTWAPVSFWRKLGRGYDQGELLARALGRELGMTPVPLLKKVRNNRRQSGIHGYAQRRANVMGVYRCVNPALVSGKRVLLVDDVLTTGATAEECARMLRTSGAREVHGAAIAAARK